MKIYRKMMNRQSKEKRSYRRLNMRLPLEYRKPESEECPFLHSVTRNVSTGGLYFETTNESLQKGDTLTFELGIPEGDNRFPKDGTISTIGKIIRLTKIGEIPDENSVPLQRIGIAACFQEGFKLEF